MVRQCTIEDIDFLIEVAKEAYPEGFDDKAARDWLAVRLWDPNLAFFRGERSAGSAMMQVKFHAPGRKQCYLIHLCAKKATNGSGWEPLAVLDALAAWGKAQGATKFWFADITGIDLNAFCKRRGGYEAGHTYVLDLDGKGTRYG